MDSPGLMFILLRPLRAGLDAGASILKRNMRQLGAQAARLHRTERCKKEEGQFEPVIFCLPSFNVSVCPWSPFSSITQQAGRLRSQLSPFFLGRRRGAVGCKPR